MSFKNIFFLLSLFFFNALSATLEEDQKAFFKAAKKYDLEKMKEILERNNLEDQKLIIQCVHKKDIIDWTPFLPLTRFSNEPTQQTLNAIKYVAEHDAFDPNLITHCSDQLEKLIDYTFYKYPETDSLTPTIEKILRSDKCTKETIGKAFEKLFEMFSEKKDALIKIKELLNLIKNKHNAFLDKEIIKKVYSHAFGSERSKESIQLFLELFPKFQTDEYHSPIENILNSKWKESSDQEKKELIDLLLNHGQTRCSLQTYKKHKELFNNPNRLSLYGYTPGKGLSLFSSLAVLIATTCYDFITFQSLKTKKEEPTQKENTNTQNADDQIKTSSKINPNKKIEEPSKKEATEEEKKERSLWKKSTSHTKAYALDLWKNPQNHKKLIVAPIALFCLALKDKIPYIKLI